LHYASFFNSIYPRGEIRKNPTANLFIQIYFVTLSASHQVSIEIDAFVAYALLRQLKELPIVNMNFKIKPCLD